MNIFEDMKVFIKPLAVVSPVSEINVNSDSVWTHYGAFEVKDVFLILKTGLKDKHNKVDDEIYGGGAGMLMAVQPVFDAINFSKTDTSKVIFLSPQGEVLTQKKCKELSNIEHLILLCGHYEGIDSRVINNYVDEEISVGDYVVTGGEIPALLLMDGGC